MPAARLSSRTDTLEIKVEIQNRLGRLKADKYFNLLTRFLSFRISKVEFDKHCKSTIGKENVHLHNHLIKSILKNAGLASVPPSPEKKTEALFGDKLVNGYQRSCLQSLKCFPQSPRKGRTPALRDRRSKDHPSPLGPKGKSHDTVSQDIVPVVVDQGGNEDVQSFGGRPPGCPRNDREEVEEAHEIPGAALGPITAPLGLPQCTKRKGGVLLNGILGAVFNRSCCSHGELPDTNSLMKRLEQKLEIEGLNISFDCAKLMNRALDTYLKRLMKPGLEIAGSKNTCNLIDQRQSHASPGFNGTLKRYLSRPNGSPLVSYSDFRAAMELNPLILGPHWPVELEKVCLLASEALN